MSSSSNLPFYLFTGQQQTGVGGNRADASSFYGTNFGSDGQYVDERTRFLEKLRTERAAREQDARRNNMATKIQRHWRGYSARNNLKLQYRKEFDEVFNFNNATSTSTTIKVDDHTLMDQAKMLHYFFNPNSDLKRVACLISHVKASGILSRTVNNKSTEYCIGSCIICCIKYLKYIAHTNESLADPLRCIEIYFRSENVKMNSVCRILKAGYYETLKIISKHRLPDDLIEETIKAPTIFADNVRQFYLYPLDYLERVTNNGKFQAYVLQNFLTSFSQKLSRIDRFYFLPAFGKALLFDEISRSFEEFDCLNCPPHVTKLKNTAEFVYVVLYLMANCDSKKSINPTAYALTLSKVLTLLSIDRLANSQTTNLSSKVKSEPMEIDQDANSVDYIKKIALLCNSPRICRTVVCLIEKTSDPARSEIFAHILQACQILVELQLRDSSVQNHSFLMTLSMMPSFLVFVWRTVTSLTVSGISGGNESFLDMLKRSNHLTAADRKRCLPILRVFCELFSSNLRSASDDEIQHIGAIPSTFPFDKHQLIEVCGDLRDIGMGLIELALPDATPAVAERYREVLLEMGADLSPDITEHWNRLYKSVIGVLQLLYQRDQRLKLCPAGHWSVKNSITLRHSHLFRKSYRDDGQLFRVARYLSRQELEENKHELLTSSEKRTLAVLRNVPFLIPFKERVAFLYQLTLRDKQLEGRAGFWNQGHQITVNRQTIYEDSFAALSPESMPNLKKLLRVSMRNWAGAAEAGIDGGGIFREFISELVKAGFDPGRGLFRSTHDNQLYPNYLSRKIFPDDFRRQFYFLGRILGKLIYENQLAELPLAKFFLSRLLNRHCVDVEVHHLESFDPILYRNLISLKSPQTDVNALNLDFSVMVDDFGFIEIVDLKPNGRHISVTNENKLEYVQLMSNFYLDVQIKDQIKSFCDGISELIDLDWLQMFDPSELQTIISGVDRIFDVDDLKAHVTYQGEYDDDIIGSFWRVVRGFTDEQKRKLLKFVTGCSRPPLLGFKDLNPPFAIQVVPADQNRLPTAATCMNLLKLPKFKESDLLKQKLCYAIESDVGFELS